MVNFFKWIFIQAWPVFAFIPILSIHLLLACTPCLNNDFLCFNNVEINKTISFIMQLSGGLLILISIDSNIELFKSNSLVGMVKSWYGKRPWKKLEKPKGVEASISITLPAMQCNARGYQEPTTIEGKLDLLQTRIDWINEDIKNNQKVTGDKLQSLESAVSQNSNNQTQQIKNIQNDLVQSSVGGVKFQVFGVLLVFYSSILSFFA
jgi:hypothetical protein